MPATIPISHEAEAMIRKWRRLSHADRRMLIAKLHASRLRTEVNAASLAGLGYAIDDMTAEVAAMSIVIFMLEALSE